MKLTRHQCGRCCAATDRPRLCIRCDAIERRMELRRDLADAAVCAAVAAIFALLGAII